MSMSTVAKSPAKLANPGVELDTKRVGTYLNYLEDARVGETVSFKYQGGSDPGGVRTVLVQKVEGEGVAGATLEREGEYRSYLDRNRIGLPHVVSPFVAPLESATDGLVENRVRFDAAKSALLAVLTAEQLASLYQQHVAKDSKGVSYDSSKGELVVKTEQPKPIFNTDLKQNRLKVSKDKKSVTIYLYTGGVGTDVFGLEGEVHSTNISPETLVRQLNKLLA